MPNSLQPHESQHARPHQLPELTQTHVHRVSDAIQPSILGRPLLLLLPIPPSIRVFSNESPLLMRWPKYWSFSFSIILSKEIPGLISFRRDWLDLLAVGVQYATGGQWKNNYRKNEGMEPKQKQYPDVDVTGDRSKVRCCKE